ncbi:TetR family transcriptional regulator [Pseudoflavonifractor sp. BIOML-A6]|nr:TetR family transcriptional regulator [Pseudoflavonifractor sp. BIOML-A16]MTR07113.1 TetR family transcriptional regulator [Pseudoflavonifractor sp. BIOML-A15]MTR13411.1 TetR family transcriptional regulator [Pseudoflavonifractor sp. BIOML-A17]MTR21270.1 TetR family transcriptional regulator [Pseudoflavonifractor sp. BIOML-A19]MTR32324.1 TetR family transcriptional regulator [Pseudoflavonifractor sp. BIOML-A14]MTR35636.1 TetR family transcriptional regulator [Pseudoflavonifractor sp. BIOML-
MTTKEKIAQAALELFSVRGYEAVSVRDIAGAVGIKESSIYNHFKCKQAIFDALVEESGRQIEAIFAPYHLTGRPGPALAEMDFMRDTEALAALTGDVFLRFITDDGLRMFRQMLTLEQYRNGEAGRCYRDIFIEAPIRFQTALFAQMMQRGIFRPGDPGAAAAQFYGPIFLLFSRCGGSAEEDAVRSALRDHVLQFASVYETEPNH